MNQPTFSFSSTIKPIALLSTLLLLIAATPVHANYEQGIEQYMKGNYKKALKAFTQSAKQGDARAQFHIGNMYENGFGVKKSKSKSIQWYKKAAKKGNPHAQYNLGVLYYTGDGVNQSQETAFKWWLRSAEQKLASAQFNVAIAYAKGEGVKQSNTKSYMWAAIASHFGNQQSTMFMNDMVLTMSLKQLNNAERLANQWIDNH